MLHTGGLKHIGDTEEPSLVPQWLKDGGLSRNGCSARPSRPGPSDTIGRSPAAGPRLGSALQEPGSQDSQKGAAFGVGRVGSLRVNPGSKPGSSWSTKPGTPVRLSAFEHSAGGPARADSGLHEHWHSSPDANAPSVLDRDRNEWNLTKDFAPRSSALYSPHQSDEALLDGNEASFDKVFPTLQNSGPSAVQHVPLASEFPVLVPSSSGKAGHSWGSSLTDGHGRTAAKAGTFAAHNGLRMAEALQIVQPGGAALGEKAARDQLAVKQSKQLVPVIASSTKHKHGMRQAPDAKPAAPVLDARKELVTARSLPKPSEAPDAKKAQHVMLALKPQGSLRAANRTTFFKSLQRSASAGPTSVGDPSSGVAAPAKPSVKLGATAEAATEARAGGQSGEPAPVTRTSDPRMADSWDTLHQSAAPSAAAACNGHSHAEHAEEQAIAWTPEEEAFLRSLGWTDACGDEEDYALTEEEVAAFKASMQRRQQPPARPTLSVLPVSPRPHSSLDHYGYIDSDSDASTGSDLS